MPSPELIEPHAAVYRLADEWNIPHQAAEQIVKGVLHDGQCYVRGRHRGGPLRDISRDLATALASSYCPHGPVPWGFTDVQMDWNGLLKHGRVLVPTAYESDVATAEARAADVQVGSNGKHPLNEKMADKITANYIKRKEAAREPPTLQDLERTAQEDGFVGGRQYLRNAFRRMRGPLKRGPRDNSRRN
jgi:hypothetical protein